MKLSLSRRLDGLFGAGTSAVCARAPDLDILSCSMATAKEIIMLGFTKCARTHSNVLDLRHLVSAKGRCFGSRKPKIVYLASCSEVFFCEISSDFVRASVVDCGEIW